MSDHPLTPKSNSKIVPPFIPKPKESLEAENARLKAEVERLEAENEGLKKLVGLHESIDTAIDAWIESKKNAAKDGKSTDGV